MSIARPMLESIELFTAIAHFYKYTTSDKERTLEIFFKDGITELVCIEKELKLTFEVVGKSVEIKCYDTSSSLLQVAVGHLNNRPEIEDHIILTFDL